LITGVWPGSTPVITDSLSFRYGAAAVLVETAVLDANKCITLGCTAKFYVQNV